MPETLFSFYSWQITPGSSSLTARNNSRQFQKSKSLGISRYLIFLIYLNRVKSLSTLLRDVDDVLPRRSLTCQQHVKLDSMVVRCRSVLDELNKMLVTYRELDPDAKPSGRRLQKTWKRFIWDQSYIDNFRSRITTNVLLFNTFLEQINR